MYRGVFSLLFAVSVHHLDLTEVWRTRPERTMSGVVRGLADSFVPVGGWAWRGEVGGGFRGTGHGPFRALIVSSLRGDGNLVAATTYFR